MYGLVHEALVPRVMEQLLVSQTCTSLHVSSQLPFDLSHSLRELAHCASFNVLIHKWEQQLYWWDCCKAGKFLLPSLRRSHSTDTKPSISCVHIPICTHTELITRECTRAHIR